MEACFKPISDIFFATLFLVIVTLSSNCDLIQFTTSYLTMWLYISKCDFMSGNWDFISHNFNFVSQLWFYLTQCNFISHNVTLYLIIATFLPIMILYLTLWLSLWLCILYSNLFSHSCDFISHNCNFVS